MVKVTKYVKMSQLYIDIFVCSAKFDYFQYENCKKKLTCGILARHTDGNERNLHFSSWKYIFHIII